MTTTPTPPAEVDVAEGERLLASVAAPRPWRQSLTDDTMILTMDSREVAAIDGDYNSPDEWPVMEANAALIVFAVNNLPALLRAASERDAAVREAERLREAMLSAATICDYWADESRNDGWSTHQVEPNRRLAASLRKAALGAAP